MFVFNQILQKFVSYVPINDMSPMVQAMAIWEAGNNISPKWSLKYLIARPYIVYITEIWLFSMVNFSDINLFFKSMLMHIVMYKAIDIWY